jgi:ABC-type multidrug transport system fused ATPase/permease subunit
MLLVIDTISAIAALLLFVFVGIKLNALYQEKSRVLGKQSKEKAVRVNEQISELLGLFREIVTRDTQNVYVNSIYSQRLSQANIAVAQKMIPLISKYTIDILIILLVVLVSTVQFYSNDSSRAVGNLALFLAASSRIAPAMLRTQQGYFQVKSNIGIGESTINLLNKISLVEKKDLSSKPSELISIPSWDGCPKIVFNKVSFRYDDLENWSLRNINLVIEPQTFVALVGPSGGGKSSLVDLLFGLLEPNAGEVLINGVPARQALSLYPGQFGYVPQTVELVQGTLLDNMALGLEKSEDFLKKTEKIVRLVGLGEFIEKLPQGLETKVGEKGLRLSGGQIQRLGIARALVNEPKILVLDESTSALDALSENSISSGLQTLRDKMTLIVIAHRLSTIRDADRVIYLDQGRIVAEGTFHELRQSLPDFDFQAKLMGL